MNRRLGVCSWSLQPENPSDLADKLARTQLRAVQIALDPIRTRAWDQAATWNSLGGAFLSGMMGTKGEDYSTLQSIRLTGGVRPDSTWAENLNAARENAIIAKRMGISLVTLHAGFLPHDRNDAQRATMLDRLKRIADVFSGQGVRIAFETGQESAHTLLEVLDDLKRPEVGVNFDPANMILYGMGDPIQAVRLLGPRIAQFHIKDAIPAQIPGTWGEEVVVGTGAVHWREFFEAIADIPGDFVLEREAGDHRERDIAAARQFVERSLSTPASKVTSSRSKSLGIGVIGLGVMGRTHIKAYQAAASRGLPCHLVAVCSPDTEQLTGLPAGSGNLKAIAGQERVFDPAKVRTTTNPAEIAADPAVDLVSICTPTDTHADLAIAMLRAGKHVLVEKPVAITTDAVQRVADEARRSGKFCMPGMCMRFWPGWDWLKEKVEDQQFGRVTSAVFTRVGSRPDWSREFYHDSERTGGAMFDLHVHDADIILWLFGTPRAVRSMGSIDHITTLYDFGPSGPRHVSAEGAWVSSAGFPFRMRYTVEFERAVADWDLMRPEQLIVAQEGKARPVPLPSQSAYDLEVAHFVSVVSGGGDLRANVADAVLVAELLQAERRSLATGHSVEMTPP